MNSRIAPTPSGFLHLGNAFNFALTWAETRKAGGKLRLRIDDLDVQRTRPEFVEDIFEVLNWMGLDYDLGPKDAADHFKNYSQTLRRDRYLQAVLWLLNQGAAYVCSCSRQSLEREDCRCREKALVFAPEQSAVRVAGGQGRVALGDFTIWRREGTPAFQLVSLIDDLDHGTDLIVRGEDLLPSTEAQKYLAGLFGTEFAADRFSKVRFIHHELLRGPGGAKLSKSSQATALRERMRRGESGRALMGELLKLRP